jgi:hypothetical protein
MKRNANSRTIFTAVSRYDQMRLRCTECGKSVSTEVPDETVVRAWLMCPECIEQWVKDGRLQEKAEEDIARGSRLSKHRFKG